MNFLKDVVNFLDYVWGLVKWYSIQFRDTFLVAFNDLSSTMKLSAVVAFIVLGLIVLLLVIYIVRLFFLLKLKMNKQITFEPYNKQYTFKWLRAYKNMRANRKKHEPKGILIVIHFIVASILFIIDMIILLVLYICNGIGKVLNLFRARLQNQEVDNTISIEKQASNNTDFFNMVNNYAKILKENENLKHNNLDALTLEKDKEIESLKHEISTFRSSFELKDNQAKNQLHEFRHELLDVLLNVLNHVEIKELRPFLKSTFDKYHLEVIEPLEKDYFSERLMVVDHEEPTKDKKQDGKIKDVTKLGMYNTETNEVYQKASVVLYRFGLSTDDELTQKDITIEKEEQATIIEEEIIEPTIVDEQEVLEQPTLEDIEEQLEEDLQLDEEPKELEEVLEPKPEDEELEEDLEEPQESEEDQKVLLEEEPQDEVEELQDIEPLEDVESIELLEENIEDIPEEVILQKVVDDYQNLEEPEEDIETVEDLEESLEELVEIIDSSDSENKKKPEVLEEEPEEDEEVEDLIQAELNKWMNNKE